MSIKRKFETAPHADAYSALRRNRKRTEIAFRLHFGFGAAGRA
jgi:hypothetical protein